MLPAHQNTASSEDGSRPWIFPVAAVILGTAIPLLLAWQWDQDGRHGMTGDEPHYLVMADGLARYGSLEQTRPYADELRDLRIFPPGLQNTHKVIGPRGAYNWHFPGLPLLLAFPFAWGGIWGVRCALALALGMVAWGAWRISGHDHQSPLRRFTISLLMVTSPGLVLAATQVYPEMAAGAFSLLVLLEIDSQARGRPGAAVPVPWHIVLMMAFLPWLHLRFLSVSLVFLGGLLLSTRNRFPGQGPCPPWVCVPLLSYGVLAAHNMYAYGSLAGPQVGTLALSKASGMVLLGLLYDQNQGLLFRNPLMFSALAGLGLLWRQRPFTFTVWLCALGALLVPVSLQTSLYGGASFSGRFGVPAAILCVWPSVLALSWPLPRITQGLTRAAGAILVVVALWISVLAALKDVSLLNQTSMTIAEEYSHFFAPLDVYLPMLYDPTWAAMFLPNYTWLVLIVVVTGGGWIRGVWPWPLRLGVVVIAAGTVAATSLGPLPPPSHREWSGAQLAGAVGRVSGTSRAAVAAHDTPGFLTYGPYYPLRRGEYEVTVEYLSDAPSSVTDVTLNVVTAADGRAICSLPLSGTESRLTTATCRLSATWFRPKAVEFRTRWDGNRDVRVVRVMLRLLPAA